MERFSYRREYITDIKTVNKTIGLLGGGKDIVHVCKILHSDNKYAHYNHTFKIAFLTSSSESLHAPLDDPLLLVDPGFCGCGAETGWLALPLKNTFPGTPLLGGDGERDGEDAEEVDGLGLFAVGGVMWARPGQKDGFHGVE